MNNRTVLTIGIPVYNCESKIGRCLDSIIDCIGFDDYEIIVVNDGSTDNSLKIVNDYTIKYNNIRVFDCENRGAFLSRNTIIDEAKGEWIGFVDADDTIERDMYNKMLSVANSNDTLDVITCAFNKIDASGKTVVQMNCYGNRQFNFYNNPYQRGILIGVNPAYWNKIFRKKCFENHFTLLYSPKIMEDYLLMASIFPLINGIGFIETPLYNYYDNFGSVTKRIGKKELFAAQESLNYLYEYLEEKESYKNNNYAKALIKIMTRLHLGVAFTINWNCFGEMKIFEVWNRTKSYLDNEFKDIDERCFMRFGYAYKYGSLRKLFFAYKLYDCKIWPLLVIGYHAICNIFKTDLKW